MISTIEQFEAAYSYASPTQKYLCSCSGNELRSIATKHGITDQSAYTKFGLLVGDVILGITKVSDLQITLSQEIGLDDLAANKVTRDLIDFLAPLSDPNWQPPLETLTSPKTSPEASVAATDIAIELAETEAEIQSIPALRTMSGNSQFKPESGEPVYSSTQAAIISEALRVPTEQPPLRTAPTPNQSTTSAPVRWDSEPT